MKISIYYMYIMFFIIVFSTTSSHIIAQEQAQDLNTENTEAQSLHKENTDDQEENDNQVTTDEVKPGQKVIRPNDQSETAPIIINIS